MPSVLSLTPERQRLADAMAHVSGLEAEIGTLPTLISEAEMSYHEAGQKLREAERSLERTQALANQPNSFSPPPRPPASFWSEEDHQAYVAELDVPPMPIGEARAAVETAKEAQQSATANIGFLRAKLARLGQDMRRGQNDVAKAKRAVVKADPALAALALECRRLATRLASAKLAFASATNEDVMPPDSLFYRCAEPSTFQEDPEGWAFSRAWHEALDRLDTDPATLLPLPEADR